MVSVLLKRLRWFVHLLLRSLILQWKRVRWIVFSMAMAVLITTAMAQLFWGIREKLGSSLRRSGANLRVAPRTLELRFGEYDLGTLAEKARFSEEKLLAACSSFAGGRIVCWPILREVGWRGKDALSLIGIDWHGLHQQSGFSRCMGKWPAQETEVLLGSTLAERLSLMPATTLEMTVGGQPVSWAITGILETGSQEDEGIWLDKRYLQRLVSPGKVSEALLQVPEETIGPWTATLEKKFPELHVERLRDLTLPTESLLRKVSLLLFLVMVVVVSSAIVSVVSTMGVILLERRQELGLMKALGASRGMICRLWLAEALVLGMAGGILGFGLGVLLSEWCSRRLFAVSLGVHPLSMGMAIATAATIALLGSMVSLRQVLRWTPVAMLRE